jgi:CubicO group peptidase (beta-lactamase class C family)
MSEIDTKHLWLGGDSGFLGKGIGIEKDCADGKGRFREYEHGRIYSSPEGVHEVHGSILKRWLALGAEAGELGYPQTDERHVSDEVGRYSEFEKGVIYWSPSTGAHEVRRDILSKWRMFGGPRGVLGYPTSGEADTIKDGKFNNFENGAIFWRQATSAFVVRGDIHKQWIAQGGVSGALGFPMSDELPSAIFNTRFVKFENGTLNRTVASSTPATETETVPPVIEAHDKALDKLKSDHEKHSGKGFRILSLSIYGDPANPLYACLWVKDGGPEQHILFKGSNQEFLNFLNDPANKDFHPTLVSATGPAEAAVFALVCEKRKGPPPVLRHRLVSGPVGSIHNPETFAYWCQRARGTQRILRSASIYGSPGSPRYAGIWELNRGEVPWNVAYHDTDKKIATNFLAEHDPDLFDRGEMPEITHAQAFWARPAFATRSPHGHELRVFRADRVVNWVLRDDRSLEQYLSDLAEWTKKGFVPVCLQGVRVAGESRFTVILAKRVKPQPRKLTVMGNQSSALAAFDEAMGEMVKSTGARAASLAIAKDGRLVYARAFTWAEADQPVVQPTHLFRIASCSKPITSVGVYQLADEKRLKREPGGRLAATPLTNFLKSNVKLTLPANTKVAENFNAITLSQVLMHKAGFRKPIAHDEEVLEAFNKSMFIKGAKRALPMTMLQVASYMATVPLKFEPGKDTLYSNVGFLFLCLLIEQNLGKPYEQAMQERIFKKVGVTRARITESSTNLKADEVIALDRQLRVGRSVMEKERPIVPHEYGTLNRDIRPGTGGWVMAPADYVRFLSVLHSGSGTLLKPETVESAERIKSHGGGIDGAVAHVEQMNNGFTFAVFFAINFFGDFEMRIRDIIKALPASAWPAGDLFPSLGIQ